MNGSTKFAVPTCTASAPAMVNSSASFAVHDAAHADDRNLHRLPAFVDHAHGDRPDRRSAQSAEHVGDLRPPRLDVDRQRQERVDERHGIRARFRRRARERRDVGDVRRQLRDQRKLRHLAHGGHHIVRAAEAAAELDAAFLDVRARDVQLDRARRLRDPTGSATLPRIRPGCCRTRSPSSSRRSARSSGSRSLTKRWTPMPCRPIALIMPAGVSTMRWRRGGLHVR